MVAFPDACFESNDMGLTKRCNHNSPVNILEILAGHLCDLLNVVDRVRRKAPPRLLPIMYTNYSGTPKTGPGLPGTVSVKKYNPSLLRLRQAATVNVRPPDLVPPWDNAPGQKPLVSNA